MLTIEQLKAKRKELENEISDINASIREIEDADKHYYLVYLDNTTDYEASSEIYRTGFCTKTEAEQRAIEEFPEEFEIYKVREITEEENSLYYDGERFAEAIKALDRIEWVYAERKEYDKRHEMYELKEKLREEKREIERKIDVYDIR